MILPTKSKLIDDSGGCGGRRGRMAAKLRWVMQLHRDVPKAARFYSQGLDFTIHVCTLRWAELHSGPLSLALLHFPSELVAQKGYSSLLSFTVPDIGSMVTKLMALGAELDGPIKHEIHGKVAAMRCLDGHMIGLYDLRDTVIALMMLLWNALGFPNIALK